MGHEQRYDHPPETLFGACINAVAYLPWTIDERDESNLRIEIKTPFTVKKTMPSFQDVITVEVIPDGESSIVWAHSYPRFQVWNWGKDGRNERGYLDEVSREVVRLTTPGSDGDPAPGAAERPGAQTGAPPSGLRYTIRREVDHVTSTLDSDGEQGGQTPGANGDSGSQTSALDTSVERHRHAGWDLSDRTEHRAVVVRRDALYNYVVGADRRILRAEEAPAYPVAETPPAQGVPARHAGGQGAPGRQGDRPQGRQAGGHPQGRQAGGQRAPGTQGGQPQGQGTGGQNPRGGAGPGGSPQHGGTHDRGHHSGGHPSERGAEGHGSAQPPDDHGQHGRSSGHQTRERDDDALREEGATDTDG